MLLLVPCSSYRYPSPCPVITVVAGINLLTAHPLFVLKLTLAGGHGVSFLMPVSRTFLIKSRSVGLVVVQRPLYLTRDRVLKPVGRD